MSGILFRKSMKSVIVKAARLHNNTNSIEGSHAMNKYQERTIYISAGVLIFFLLLSIITNKWGFFLWSLPPVFINIMMRSEEHTSELQSRFYLVCSLSDHRDLHSFPTRRSSDLRESGSFA